MRTMRAWAWLSTLAGLAVIAIGLIVLWGLPGLLTRHPPGSLNPAEQLKAENDVRAPLVAYLVAVGAAGTLIFTGNTYLLNRRGQQIDRYSTAVGQLNDDYTPVRIGAIHALGRVGADSARERETVVQVLAAFVRLQSQKKRSGGQDRLAEDVQAALNELGPLVVRASIKADLRGADLSKAELGGIPEDCVEYNADTEMSGATDFGPPRHR